MAEEPRKKITIKLRPVGQKAAPAAAPAPATTAAPAAPTPPPATVAEQPPAASAPMPSVEAAAPAPAPAEAAPAAAPEAPKAPDTPIALKPVASAAAVPASEAVTQKFVPKKIVPPAGADAPAAPAPAEGAAQQAKRQTSRIELPPEITEQSVPVSDTAVTIKLKPISKTATPETAETPEAVQAKKSKTARIELDSVLGNIQSNAPLANTTQKTIKLQRHPRVTTATKPTTSAPMTSVTEAAPGETQEAKTIKLARPGGAKPSLGLKKNTGAPTKPTEAAPIEQLETLESLDDDSALAPIPAAPVAESTGAKVFTIISIVAAVASIIVTAVLCIILQKHGASPNGSPATGNTLHSLPFERVL